MMHMNNAEASLELDSQALLGNLNLEESSDVYVMEIVKFRILRIKEQDNQILLSFRVW